MAESYLRHLEILRLLPRYPSQKTTTKIHNDIKTFGYNVSLKTTQRDLNMLSSVFPIVSYDEGKPFGWGWSVDAGLMDLPTMDQKTALTFGLVEAYLSKMLPDAVYQFLTPHFERARIILDQNKNSGMRKWIEKISVIPNGQVLMISTINKKVRDVVFEGLLQERRIEITYKRPNVEVLKTYPVSPIGIVFRNESVYLVGIAKDYEESTQFHLSRIINARLLNEKFNLSDHQTLQTLINRNEFAYPVDDGPELINLELLLNEYYAQRLQETPLSENQSVKIRKNGWFHLRAKVPNTHDLRIWILGLGNSVEVIKPSFLRTEFKEHALELMQRYCD